MKTTTFYHRITLIISLIFLSFTLLYGKYCVWYGRDNWRNFEFNENITVHELQTVYSKDQFHNFLNFKFKNNCNENEAINKFWEETKHTPISNTSVEASLDLVKEVYPNAKDTLRATIYKQSMQARINDIYPVILLLLILLIIPIKKLKITIAYIIFNFMYLSALGTIGAILPLILLNLFVFTSSLVNEFPSLRRLAFFNKLNILCTKMLWKWNFLEKLKLPDFSHLRLILEGCILMLISAIMLALPSILILLLNVPTLFIIFLMVSELNNNLEKV